MWNILLEFAGGFLFGAAVALIVSTIIDASVVKDKAKEKYPNKSLKLLIKSKNTRKVDVGIYNRKTGEHYDDIQIGSEKGVSESLYEGQELYA